MASEIEQRRAEKTEAEEGHLSKFVLSFRMRLGLSH
jgi:hypothetical protein